MKQEDIVHLTPDQLHTVHEKFKLIGLVLGQLALIEVVCDPNASDTARASAGKTLTSLKEDPITISERLKESQFADMSPEELKTFISDLKTGDKTVDHLLEEE
jgi:hypothetical protein